MIEEKRPGQYYPVEEDERGTYIFNAKDLCLLRVLPELMATGIDSLKIEGRMKSIFYVGGVVRVYRAVLDYLADLPESAWHNPSGIEIPHRFVKEIQNTGRFQSTSTKIQMHLLMPSHGHGSSFFTETWGQKFVIWDLMFQKKISSGRTL